MAQINYNKQIVVNLYDRDGLRAGKYTIPLIEWVCQKHGRDLDALAVMKENEQARWLAAANKRCDDYARQNGLSGLL